MILLFPAGPAQKADVPAPIGTPPAIPSFAFSASDRTYKLDLIGNMEKPPQLIVFGGSRATRFDPDYLHTVTGPRSFNAAFSNGRPTDAWAITRYLLQEHPTLRLRVFWPVQWTLFYDKQLDSGLVQDPRLAAAFDQETLDDAAADQVAYMRGGAPPKLWYPAGYAANGLLLNNWYDVLEAQGRTLDTAVRIWVGQTKATLNDSAVHRKDWSLNRVCFAHTLSPLNSIGVRPLIVVMPTQPLAIQLLGRDWWEATVTNFLVQLRTLRKRYRFALLDYSSIEAFGGDPGDFYDGVHVKAENARRVVAAAWRDAGWAFR